MKNYVKINLGSIPKSFKGRELDFYKCLAFATIMVAQEREWVGYKELEKAKIDADDLVELDIISLPTEKGTYKLYRNDKVTYKDNFVYETYWLDTFVIGKAKLSGVIMDRDPKWMTTSEEFLAYDQEQYDALPKCWQNWFRKTLNCDLDCPAKDLLEKLTIKLLYRDYSYNKQKANKLPDEIKDWFVKKVQSRDFLDNTAEDFLDKVVRKFGKKS